jgi:hypothetical protein
MKFLRFQKTVNEIAQIALINSAKEKEKKERKK